MRKYNLLAVYKRLSERDEERVFVCGGGWYSRDAKKERKRERESESRPETSEWVVV